MKNQKKFYYKVAAFLCALVVAVSCLGVPSEYKAEVEPANLNEFLGMCGLPKFENYNSNYGYICSLEYNGSISLIEITKNGFLYNSTYQGKTQFCGKHESGNGYELVDGEWICTASNYVTPGYVVYGYGYKLHTEFDLLYFNVPLYSDEQQSALVCPSYYKIKDMGVVDVVYPEKYNSSIGYLQNLLCKELYLENANYAYDPEALKKIWSFGNTSTTGLDITDGTWSIRHYQQITVRDTDIVNPVVKEYDMVLMDEFPAESLRYEYMAKDYSSMLEEKSGFEPLGFWDSTVLGRFVFTRNYFQLVRTNEDGSVEYGGYVKVDLKGSPAANDFNAEHETTTVTPEGVVDDGGYVGGNMDYIQGSGSDYGQAENEADKEAEKENSSSGGSQNMVDQVNNLVAVVMAVPRLISELFSFLPSWCLDFVGIAFTLSIGILVYKLAN